MDASTAYLRSVGAKEKAETMADSDLIKLYSGRILALAAEMPHTRTLVAPTATARRRSPLCGSTVTVQIRTEDGRITDFGQDVKACALGQAAASVVGANVIGRTRAEVERARDQLKAMLKADGPVPDAPFDGLEVLAPARDYKNRHASIMLALEATAEAFETAEKAACA
jgi:NifU-like protein involved in Fe-S cluster formation